MQLEHILQAHGLLGRGGSKSKDEIPPPPITNFIATVVGDSIKLTWTNPDDTDFVGVRIVRKTGSYPSSTNDGLVVYEGNLQEFIDENITKGIRHYYRAFTYDFDNNYNYDTGQQVSEIVKISQSAPSAPTMASRTSTSITLNAMEGCEYRVDSGNWQDSVVFSGLSIATSYTFYARRKETPTHYASPASSGVTFTTDKGTQSAPSAPTVSNIEHDRATVTGATGTEVRIGSGAWYDSPHTFVGLTEETTYQAYARRKETSTHYASPISSAKSFTTPAAIDPNSWQGIQSIVRRGLTHDYFSVGDQLVSAYDGGEIIWEVIGIDVDTPADSNYTHSMTLQTKDCLHNIQFDAPEPNNSDSSRQSYGNNRYIHSAVKQWLNSDELSFSWQSQHQYDSKPTDSLDLYNGAGFLHRLDPELVAVLGEVNKQVAQANVDGGGQDNFSDKVFLLSRVEVGLGTEGDVAGEFVYPYYDGVGDASRIKTLNGSTRNWWLRSPNVGDSNYVRGVNTSGAVRSYSARVATGLSPACVII